MDRSIRRFRLALIKRNIIRACIASTQRTRGYSRAYSEEQKAKRLQEYIHDSLVGEGHGSRRGVNWHCDCEWCNGGAIAQRQREEDILNHDAWDYSWNGEPIQVCWPGDEGMYDFYWDCEDEYFTFSDAPSTRELCIT